MSQKNYASYGDMETLLTEVASKCGPYTEITYEDWLQLTPYQQEHGRWDVTGVPGADGTISIDLMTKLWENPDPTQEIAADTEINVNTAGYDLIMVISQYNTAYPQYRNAFIMQQGRGTTLIHSSTKGAPFMVRNFIYVSDTKYKCGQGYYEETANDTASIPTVIYGIKLHHTVEIKTIAPTVSTLAENCVFDPTGTDLESTDVEAAIKELESNFQDGVDAVYDAVVAKGSTPASHSLSDVVDGIAAIPTGITPTGTINITANGNSQDVSSYQYANVNVPNSNSGTYTASSRSAALDMGAANTYRYVNTNGVPNSNSTTYTATTRSAKIDLGSTNSYRYLVTSNVPNTNSGTYTASSSSSALDMGATNTYRYVNTSGLTKVSGTKTITANGNSIDVKTYQYAKVSVPNSNSGTYTYGSGSTGGSVDLGSTNSYRYVNAANVYAKGKADGDVVRTIHCYHNGRSVRICRSQNPDDYYKSFTADATSDWTYDGSFNA